MRVLRRACKQLKYDRKWFWTIGIISFIISVLIFMNVGWSNYNDILTRRISKKMLSSVVMEDDSAGELPGKQLIEKSVVERIEKHLPIKHMRKERVAAAYAENFYCAGTNMGIGEWEREGGDILLLSDSTKKLNGQDIMISSEVADFNNLDIGDILVIGSADHKQKVELKIAKIYEKKFDHLYPVRYDKSNWIYASEEMLVDFTGSDNYKKVEFDVPQEVSSGDVYELLEEHPKEWNIRIYDFEKQLAEQSIESLRFTRTMINMVVWLVGCLTLCVTIMTHMYERDGEIGILMAMGEKKINIFRELFYEAVIPMLLATGMALLIACAVMIFAGEVCFGWKEIVAIGAVNIAIALLAIMASCIRIFRCSSWKLLKG